MDAVTPDPAGSLAIAIDPSSAVPPFEQLRARIVDDVARGTLAAGARLPTVRRLADQLGIAPGTVARAYRELEAAGVIETRGRNGTFVSFDTDPLTRRLQQSAAEFAALVRELGVDDDAALAAVAAALEAGAPAS